MLSNLSIIQLWSRFSSTLCYHFNIELCKVTILVFVLLRTAKSNGDTKTASWRLFFHFWLFCENLFWFLLSIVGFLRNMKLCLKFKLQNKCNSIIQVVKKFKDTLKSDLNSVNSRFKKVKILTGYGIKLVLNVFLPLTDFVTDLCFVSSIYGDNLFFASGIYILHTNTKFSCIILKLRFYELWFKSRDIFSPAHFCT